MAREKGVRVGGERTFVLSDPPDDPLAYQGLSLRLLRTRHLAARRQASPAAKRTLREIGNASLWLTAPDGDLAYFGPQPGAGVGARRDRLRRRGRPPGWPTTTPRSRAASARSPQRALERLRDVYGVGRFGLNITPGVKAGRHVRRRRASTAAPAARRSAG